MGAKEKNPKMGKVVKSFVHWQCVEDSRAQLKMTIIGQFDGQWREIEELTVRGRNDSQMGPKRAGWKERGVGLGEALVCGKCRH